jgi:hypothetical protein
MGAMAEGFGAGHGDFRGRPLPESRCAGAPRRPRLHSLGRPRGSLCAPARPSPPGGAGVLDEVQHDDGQNDQRGNDGGPAGKPAPAKAPAHRRRTPYRSRSVDASNGGALGPEDHAPQRKPTPVTTWPATRRAGSPTSVPLYHVGGN